MIPIVQYDASPSAPADIQTPQILGIRPRHKTFPSFLTLKTTMQTALGIAVASEAQMVEHRESILVALVSLNSWQDYIEFIKTNFNPTFRSLHVDGTSSPDLAAHISWLESTKGVASYYECQKFQITSKVEPDRRSATT